MKRFFLRSFWPWETRQERQQRHEEIMNGLQRLTEASADTTKAVDELVEAWNRPDATDEALIALAVTQEANNARIRATIGTPKPTA
jgi:hypothetical protein